MFKNSVFKPSVSTVKWFKAAGIRAIKSMAQTAVAMIAVGSAMNETDWLNVVSVSVATGIASILTSVAGIPEVSEN